jgi:CBS domain-containing protein
VASALPACISLVRWVVQMTTVRQILEAKGHEVVSVGTNSTVYDAIKKMADNNIGSVTIVHSGRLVGIFTERHYARRVFLKGKASPDTPIADVMAKNPICAVPEQTVEQCMAVMTENRIRHLPVIDNDQMIGIISIGDLVKSKISDQQFIIGTLEHYIRGTGDYSVDKG